MAEKNIPLGAVGEAVVVMTESELDSTLATMGGELSAGYLSQASPLNNLVTPVVEAFLAEVKSATRKEYYVTGQYKLFGLVVDSQFVSRKSPSFTFYKQPKTGKIVYSFLKSETMMVTFELKVSQ